MRYDSSFKISSIVVSNLIQTLYRSRVDLHEAREGILNLFKDTAIANSEHTASQIQQRQLSHESALRIQQTLDLVRTNQLQLLSEAFARLSNAVVCGYSLLA